MKTFQPKSKDIKRNRQVLDAKGKILGRLASQVSSILIGKTKPWYAPHLDSGDFVVVTNVDKLKVTGKKEENKKYYRHSGYPGGLKTTTYSKLKQEHPERILRFAVSGMLPDNRLKAPRLKRLIIMGEREI